MFPGFFGILPEDEVGIRVVHCYDGLNERCVRDIDSRGEGSGEDTQVTLMYNTQ